MPEGHSERAELMSVPAAALWWTARCVACGAPSVTQHDDHAPAASARGGRIDVPAHLPPVELCEEHWADYETDWLLLGWCIGHYAEALRYCEEHHRTVEPL